MLLAMCSNSSAQDFVKGGNYVSVGYGVDAGGLPGNFGGLGLGPVSATYERGVTDIIGIGRIGAGGGIAFSHYNYSDKLNILFASTESQYRTNRITPFVRATYHFEFDIEKMDVYAGLGFGVNIDSEKEKYFINGVLSSEISDIRVFPVPIIVAGIRYYFSDFFGVYFEVGHGIANVNGGIVLSF